MPTPVGPAPRDPNDPDFWDWEGDSDAPAARHPVRAVVALLLIASLVVLILVSVL